MQIPPLKTIQAVLNRQVDYRARRSAMHFRNFFRCLDAKGLVTDDEEQVVRIELTQRCKVYYDNYCSKQITVRIQERRAAASG